MVNRLVAADRGKILVDEVTVPVSSVSSFEVENYGNIEVAELREGCPLGISKII